ncbi:hypothetical protein [Bremerella sp. P1]|uniref:hypothetical protein n=1 Tax=Bremerella sp. P1 TaxID=3026424 RepID=UPI0023676D4F|nr:hypothetical protein [Bremerella sp. P1]WDI42272.1 hypothetical protein PSR63_27855 [Bremerella sp. P1]
MELFLQIVGGVFLALVLFVVVAYLVIRWKLRSWIKSLGDMIAQGMGGAVPPFRVKLTKRSSLEDPHEDWVPEEHLKKFDAITEQFQSLGFTKLEDYVIEEIATPMRVLLDVDQSTIGVIYCHPVIGVWCDVVRRYQDGTAWTFGSTKYHGMDIPPYATQKFFPDESVEQIVTRFREEAPATDMVMITKEEYPGYFEKAYSREMDWRIERGGTTEEEIRRIAEMNGDECNDETVRQIQVQWRTAIHHFLSERALKRYRKDAELSSFQWEHLQNYGVVVHEQMQAEQLLQAYDEEYYPDIQSEWDEDDDDEYVTEMREQRAKWNQRLSELEDALHRGTPQQVFRDMIELGNGSNSHQTKWEFQTSVTEPIAADIWTRTYEEDDEEEDWDD